MLGYRYYDQKILQCFVYVVLKIFFLRSKNIQAYFVITLPVNFNIPLFFFTAYKTLIFHFKMFRSDSLFEFFNLVTKYITYFQNAKALMHSSGHNSHSYDLYSTAGW